MGSWPARDGFWTTRLETLGCPAESEPEASLEWTGAGSSNVTKERVTVVRDALAGLMKDQERRRMQRRVANDCFD